MSTFHIKFVNAKLAFENIVVLIEGSFWFRFHSIIQFLPLWSILDKAEAEPKIAVDKYKTTLLGQTKQKNSRNSGS